MCARPPDIGGGPEAWLSDVDIVLRRLRLGLKMTPWNMLLTVYGTTTNMSRLSPMSPIEISIAVRAARGLGHWGGGDLPWVAALQTLSLSPGVFVYTGIRKLGMNVNH